MFLVKWGKPKKKNQKPKTKAKIVSFLLSLLSRSLFQHQTHTHKRQTQKSSVEASLYVYIFRLVVVVAVVDDSSLEEATAAQTVSHKLPTVTARAVALEELKKAVMVPSVEYILVGR